MPFVDHCWEIIFWFSYSFPSHKCVNHSSKLSVPCYNLSDPNPFLPFGTFASRHLLRAMTLDHPLPRRRIPEIYAQA